MVGVVLEEENVTWGEADGGGGGEDILVRFGGFVCLVGLYVKIVKGGRKMVVYGVVGW